MKTFKLNRKQDRTGTSGVGLVAVGFENDLGQVFLTWIVNAKLDGGPVKSIQTVTLFDSIQDVSDLHGHGGATVLELDSIVDLETVQTIENRLQRFFAKNQSAA